MLKIKPRINIKKNFDRNFNDKVKYKETQERETLYNLLLSIINNKITSMLNSEYSKDMRSVLSEEILDTIEKLENMKTTDGDIREYKNKKINELRSLYEQVNDVNNGNQSEGLSL